MGRTTLGIRYPDMDSPNLAADIQDTMSDIDALTQAVYASSLTARATDGFRLEDGTWTGGSGGGANAQFTLAVWDTGTHWAAGSPANIVFDGGWWLVTARATFLATAGNMTWAYIRVTNPPGSTVLQQSICTGAASLLYLEGSVMLHAPVAGVTTTLEFSGATSGGANYTCSDYVFSAHRIRTL